MKQKFKAGDTVQIVDLKEAARWGLCTYLKLNTTYQIVKINGNNIRFGIALKVPQNYHPEERWYVPVTCVKLYRPNYQHTLFEL